MTLGRVLPITMRYTARGENGLFRRRTLAIGDRGVLRHLVAMLCALAFLTVGSVHGVQHLGTAFAAVEDVDSSDVPDAPQKAPLAAEHCFACAVLAVPSPADAVVPVAVGTAQVRSHPASMRSHPPNAETRPPIRTI